MKYDHAEPCKSCPYRRDAPRKLWHATEFLNLLRQDADPVRGSTFGCHEGRKLPRDQQRMCIGWLIHQKRNRTPSIQLRLRLMKDDALLELYERINENMPGLFSSLRVMCRANGVSTTIADLIARSSLGTPEALRMRRRAPRKAVQRVLKRVDELDAAEREKACGTPVRRIR